MQPHPVTGHDPDAADTCAWDALDDLPEPSAVQLRELELAATEVACEAVPGEARPAASLRPSTRRRTRSSRQVRSRRTCRLKPQLGLYLGLAVAALAVVLVICLRG